MYITCFFPKSEREGKQYFLDQQGANGEVTGAAASAPGTPHVDDIVAVQENEC